MTCFVCLLRRILDSYIWTKVKARKHNGISERMKLPYAPVNYSDSACLNSCKTTVTVFVSFEHLYSDFKRHLGSPADDCQFFRVFAAIIAGAV